MLLKQRRYGLLTVLAVLWLPLAAGEPKPAKSRDTKVEVTGTGTPLLWREPTDLSSRNLFYGPGGRDHQPGNTLIFEKEDLQGSSPKFAVKDEQGVKWTIKLGPEARPETVASRLVWAVGYFANEDYFL